MSSRRFGTDRASKERGGRRAGRGKLNHSGGGGGRLLVKVPVTGGR